MSETQFSTASQIRLQHAQQIANACPSTLYDEIALTGSSARGIATDQSDIEINFWVEELPSLDDRRTWIESLKTTDVIAHETPRSDNSYWVNAMYQGIELEAGWQTFEDINATLTQIMNAAISDHKTLRIAELVLSAKSLRGDGVLNQWQSQLQHYPPALTDILIPEALSGWLTEDWIQLRHVSQSSKEDIHRIWRIIYTLNHRWEINWKYAHHDLDALEIYPKNIANRIWDIQAAEDMKWLLPLLQLIRETLQIIPLTTYNELISYNLKQLHDLEKMLIV